jgi:methylthioribose-1-phosphate isomerase
MAAEEILASQNDDFIKTLDEACKAIALARPTAVNLEWAVQRMFSMAISKAGSPNLTEELFLEAEAIHEDDEQTNRRMGALGQELLADRKSVLTHCNAGALATAAFGTAVGVIRESWERGNRFKVFNTETRPFLQGARLTAWEFQEMGIPSTLIVDSAAGMLMNTGQIDCVITGADRIAANGDTANKIGTYSLAVLAKENGIPFYIVAPTSTIDMDLFSGDAINIEERPQQEVTHFRGEPTAPEGTVAANPAFDVTPNNYISAIVTENCICRPPFVTSLKSSVEQS